MKMKSMMIILISIVSTFVFGYVELSLTNYSEVNSTADVFYSSPDDIGGFQFNIEGADVTEVSGGDATANGLLIQSMGSTVLAFSMTGGSIPAGCGTLVELDLSGDATGLSGIVVSNPSGNAIYFEYFSFRGILTILLKEFSSSNVFEKQTELIFFSRTYSRVTYCL